jgi:hypothetical protein
MSWVLNKLEKTSIVTYIPGTPAIPGTEGTAGTPAYSYYEDVQVGSDQLISSLPPEGYDNPIYNPSTGELMGGSGGYRYFNGVKYSMTAYAEFGYTYVSASYTDQVLVEVPAVAPIPPTPGTPGTETQISSDYNLGWNAGAIGPATVAESRVITWRFSRGSVGAIVGLSATIEPQDYGYFGMKFAVMSTSGTYAIYKDGVSVVSPKPYGLNDLFALARNADGGLVLSINGGVVYETTVVGALIADASLYSAGDVIWDVSEIARSEAVINENIGASTDSDAAAVGTAIAIQRTVGPGTAYGVADATTFTGAEVTSVVVNGTVVVDGYGNTDPPGGIIIDAGGDAGGGIILLGGFP